MLKRLNLDLVQLGLLKGFLLSLQNVWDHEVGVLLRLNSLASRQQLVRQTQLVGSNNTEVSGVRNVSWQTGDSLLHDWGFLMKDVVELKTHLSVTGVGTVSLSHWGNSTSQEGTRQDPVGSFNDAGERRHDCCRQMTSRIDLVTGEGVRGGFGFPGRPLAEMKLCAGTTNKLKVLT